MQTQYVINPKSLSLGDNLLEHKITLPLHVEPINIQLWGNGVLPILDDCVISIGLEVVPKPVIMKLSGPIIRIFMSINHWMIFSPCEVCRSVRVMTIHSSKGVLIVYSKWTLNLSNYVTCHFFSCLMDSLTLSHICSFLVTVGGTHITLLSSLSCCPPWVRSNHKIISLAWAVVRAEIIMRCLTACSSLDRHLHMIHMNT
jgi:hypothetical protein